MKKELAWYQCLKYIRNDDMLKEKMAEKTQLQHILAEHMQSVLGWSVLYICGIEAVNQKNQTFLKATMMMEQLNYKIALSTPTLGHTLDTFNLCLTCLTVTVWLEIKNQVLREYME
ncbi:hypothetical protein F5146DRAFT_1004371 [Armillaria mellea]|nr:hypothetical protein F5146DRAFT_1004371 [Armillaria mellea]